MRFMINIGDVSYSTTITNPLQTESENRPRFGMNRIQILDIAHFRLIVLL